MEDGFTKHHSKGLFTFYKEQGEPQNRVTLGKRGRIKEEGSKKHCESAVNPLTNNRLQKINISLEQQPKNRHLSSRLRYDARFSSKHEIYTSKHVFSLNFPSPMKQKEQLQLTAHKTRKNKTEVETRDANDAHIQHKYLVGQLSVKEIMREGGELFQCKRQGKVKSNSLRRNPMKMSVVADRSSSIQPDSKELSLLKEANDQKRFHMQYQQKQRTKPKSKSEAPIILPRDVLEYRRQRLESNHFWEDLKERKFKREANKITINKRLEEWISINNLQAFIESRLPSIHKNQFLLSLPEQFPKV